MFLGFYSTYGVYNSLDRVRSSGMGGTESPTMHNGWAIKTGQKSPGGLRLDWTVEIVKKGGNNKISDD